ncbi:hypothetical protein [Bradyrhizobium sp. SZCCHNR3118]|uniref:hypothetical protein n=1 Tax=Bradyrhizobium sp. SZCCHNR3118 TaxID=3057468 RepID=UPI002916654C|nr:hypothetical protein [Bradyrhizobium sp. SZCCHNR3118]
MMNESVKYPTINFVTQEHHDVEMAARRENRVQEAPWLKMTFPGLNDEQLELLADHLATRLGWFTHYCEMPEGT